jgi:hypothetical protein
MAWFRFCGAREETAQLFKGKQKLFGYQVSHSSCCPNSYCTPFYVRKSCSASLGYNTSPNITFGIRFIFSSQNSATNQSSLCSLAYAELFTTLGYVFRKFDLQLCGTTEHEMNWHDCYTPATFGHLKVTIKELDM